MVTHVPVEQKGPLKEIVVKTKSPDKRSEQDSSWQWWLAQNETELKDQLLSTARFLKKTQENRIKQASIYTRLFSGKPLYNYLANVSTLDNSQQLPMGRPTANVTYSCIDTFVSRVTQNKPRPVFLTNEGHYKERHLAQTLNDFIMGEFYRTKAYQLTTLQSRDAGVLGDGFIKVLRKDNKVHLERTLGTELLTDYNDSYYGNPRGLIQMRLVDRGQMLAMFPDKEEIIFKAQIGIVDQSPLSTETITDQFIVVEGWHLESGEQYGDGRHVMACSSGILDDSAWQKPSFPFTKLSYNPQMVGFFSQGMAEILMPTQMELYKCLIVASQAIELMGVPRVLIDEFSKIVETAFNNNIGSIIKYSKNPPQFVNATSNPPEIYEYIKWLIQNAYQISGISALAATSQKPAGLNSGEAIRSYDGLFQDRLAAFSKRYSDVHTDLAYLIIDEAREIVKETGKYTTVFPNKDGTREVDLPKATVLRDTYVIQCFEESSLPKDPAGRQAKLSEMLAAGEITKQEFRRMSAFPDLQQSDSLANALEERILKMLDQIIEDGEFSPPDNFLLDPSDLATTLSVQYINKYAVTDLEDEKMQMLRDFFTHIQILKKKVQLLAPPMPAMAPNAAPGALPVQPPRPSLAPTSNVQV